VEYAVPMDFDSFYVGGLCANVTKVVMDEIATDGDSGAIWFIFFWANGANNSGVCDRTAFGNLVFVDEEDGIGSCDAVAHALSESA